MKKAMKQSTLILLLNTASIVALVFMLISLAYYGNVGKKVQAANKARFDLTDNATRFMEASSYLTNEVRAYASTGDTVYSDHYNTEVNESKNREIGVENMKKIGITSEEQALIDEMSKISNSLVPLEEKAMEQIQAGDEEAAVSYVYGKEYAASIEKINDIKTRFLEELDKRTLAEVDRLNGISQGVSYLIYFLVAVVGVLQIFTSYVTKKRMLTPVVAIQNEMEEISRGNLSAEFTLLSNTSEIGRLTEAIHVTKQELKKYISHIDETLSQMAAGNMDVTIDEDYRGEFLPIQNAMCTIVEALNLALGNINQAADQVASGAEQVADGAQELSRGAVEQASTVQELSDHIGLMEQRLELMASNATEARGCTISASGQLQLSNQKMEELSEAIRNISDASSQISGIIKMIEDIAFQTNILALNAAVEAARAGAAGKGFAVVADEVRNLAEKSSEAARSTTSLIENMLRQMQQGIELTTETTEELAKVVASSRQSTELVDKIASESDQQLEKLKEIINGIHRISSVVESNAAASEESAASAEELSSQAVTLKQAASKFKLRVR